MMPEPVPPHLGLVTALSLCVGKKKNITLQRAQKTHTAPLCHAPIFQLPLPTVYSICEYLASHQTTTLTKQCICVKNTSTTDKIALKERLRLWRSRYINENAIIWLTQHRRLTNRFEIYIKTFLGFAFLAASNVIFKKLSV